MNEEAVKRLRKDLRGKVKDRWEIGTVIRWTSNGMTSYAVLMTAAGWSTTSRYNNGYVATTVTYEELLEILSRSDSSDIRVATEWEEI